MHITIITNSISIVDVISKIIKTSMWARLYFKVKMDLLQGEVDGVASLETSPIALLRLIGWKSTLTIYGRARKARFWETTCWNMGVCSGIRPWGCTYMKARKGSTKFKKYMKKSVVCKDKRLGLKLPNIKYVAWHFKQQQGNDAMKGSTKY